jgi:hypothetical protein
LSDEPRTAWQERNANLERQRADQRDRIAALEEALRDLLDVQNGPPLIRDEKAWQKAYDKACALVDTPNTASGKPE